MLIIRVLIGTTALLLAAGAATRLFARRWSAAERHAVWTVALLLSLSLPVLLRYEPPVAVLSGPALEVQRLTITVTPDSPRPGINYETLLRYTWLTGLGSVAAWWLLGFVRVTGMVASSTEHSTYGGVPVRTCAGLRMPAVAAGPMILLPASAADWPEERLEMVLRHELAHVRRRDLLWRLAGTLACCLYWFHPLAWWAAAQQRKDSEMSCDDQVLSNCSSEQYATGLVAVAREAAGHRTPAAVMAMAKPRELEGRLLAVLDPARRRQTASTLTVITTLTLGLLTVSPLVAWQDPGVQMKGTVRDLVGVIPGAKVVLKGVSDYTFETGPDGSYSVSGIPEGLYTINVMKPGYALLTIAGRKIEVGTTARADLYLSLGKVQETITVDGGKPTGDAPAAVPGPPSRIRVSGNVQAAKLLKKVNPAYPPEAKQARVQGVVRMRAVIGKEGDIFSLTLLMSPSPNSPVRRWKR